MHEMRDADGEPSLFATADWPVGVPVIAIAGTAAEQAVDESAMAARASAVARVPVSAPTSAAPISTDRFSFIAPYCRTGYGVVGAHLLREFTQLGVPVAYFPLGHVDRSIVKNDQLGAAMDRQGQFDDAAPSVRLSQQFDLALHVGRGPRIGFPIFELDRFNASERHHLERQDRLIVTCEWARTVLLENGIWRTPIDIVPLGVDRAVFNEHVAPAAKRGRDTVFMSVGKLEARKGQRELLRAFEAAFSPKDTVQLVLICHNAFVDAARLDDMLAPFKRSPMASRITLITKPLPHQKDLAAAMAIADCAVFPARAEGWNLEALEMLAMGKRVIASACTAHTAFLTADNAKLVAIDALEESVPGEHYGRWAAWGAAQHEQLVQHLRDVHGERQRGELALNQAGVETSKQFSWTASARALMASVSLA
jgi:glycosyltransferase involved in cell wall biosynthesis